MEPSSINVKVESGVAEVALNRPHACNALSGALIDELDAFLETLPRHPVRALLVYGKGRHFAAGADIRELHGMTEQAARACGYIGCSRRLADCPVPVVCAVEGYALGGGCELVEISDIVVAAENAQFGHPEISLGTMSGAGGIQRLVRAVGTAVAMDLLLTGRKLSAAEALAAGLVSRVCAPGAAVETARALAHQLAGLPTAAVRRIKVAARSAHEMPLSQGLALEARLFHETLGTPDRLARMAAFLERPIPARNGAGR